MSTDTYTVNINVDIEFESKYGLMYNTNIGGQAFDFYALPLETQISILLQLKEVAHKLPNHAINDSGGGSKADCQLQITDEYDQQDYCLRLNR